MKLTDKETQALAAKLKARDVLTQKKAEAIAAKAKLPEAKKLITQLMGIPVGVRDLVLTYDFRKLGDGRLPQMLSERLIDRSKLPEVKSDTLYAADVTLAAIESKSLAELCKKLGI